MLNEYLNYCEGKGQTQSFSGVVAQYQNAPAERTIQTIMYMACTFMIHLLLHLTEYGVDDISLWYFVVKHSVWVYNIVPNQRSVITSIGILTKTESNHWDLRRAHVWGCHVFVMEAKLQDDQKLSKFNQRLQLG